MPSFVTKEKCDGCKDGDKIACEYICPNDLMVLDPISTEEADGKSLPRPQEIA